MFGFNSTKKRNGIRCVAVALMILLVSLDLTEGHKSCDPSVIMGLYTTACRYRRGHKDAGSPFRLWGSQRKETVPEGVPGFVLSPNDVAEIAEEEIIGIITNGLYFMEEPDNHYIHNAIRPIDNSRRLLKRHKNDAAAVVSKCCSGPAGCKPKDFSHLC